MELNIAENIKRMRRERGLTQEQLAEALGVTVGAVYKWENGLSMPEIRLLVDMAELFETSVDVILGYGWEKGSMGAAAERIRGYLKEKDFAEGTRYAERVLQKYPSSFEVVYQSAMLYFLAMMTPDKKGARRAIELFERSLTLFDQNTSADIGELTIKNRIAMCYCYMDQTDHAVELLKQNNIEGLNNAKIGLLLSQDEARAEEALPYLSDALGKAYSDIFNICGGYANAYRAQNKLGKIRDMMHWLYDLGQGLRDPDTVCFIDRGSIRILTILAEVACLEGDPDTARSHLRHARDTARRFDRAPEYHTGTGLKFYHGEAGSMAFDDMGKTARDIIENFVNDETAGKNLRPLWEEIQHEEE